MATTCTRSSITLTVALLVVATTGRGQTAMRWTPCRTSDGHPEPVCRWVAFTPRGKLITTGFPAPSASVLDGYSVSHFPVPPGQIGPIRESPGGQRWALVPQGLMEFKKGAWLLHPAQEIDASFHSAAPAADNALPFLPIRQGSVLFLLPDALRRISGEYPGEQTVLLRAAAKTTIGEFTGMAISPDEGLWISGTRGLAKAGGPVRNLEQETPWQEFLPPASAQLGHFTRPTPDAGGVAMLAESTVTHQTVVTLFDGQNWSTLPAGGRNFLHTWRTPDQTVWAATATALFQCAGAHTNWVECDDIPPGQIFDVATEPSGAFWLATSDGLVRGTLPPWSKPQPFQNLDSPVECMTLDGHGWLCFLADHKLRMWKNGAIREYPLPDTLPVSPGTPALFSLNDGSLLMNQGNGLVQLDPAAGEFHPLPAADAQPVKPLGLLPDGNLCLFHAGAHPRFEVYDGAQFRPLASPPPVQGGENDWTTLYAAHSGDLWLGGAHAVLWYHDGNWRRMISEDHNAPEGAIAFAEMADGKIWCATTDEVWEFDGRYWSPLPNRFNHINGLLKGRDRRVWLASNGGLFLFSGGVWIEHGAAEGLPAGVVTTLCEDQQEEIWVGKSHGLMVFRPEVDTDPPKTRIRWLGGNSHRLSEGETLNLLFEGKDKWDITSRDRLLYSYQLDQHGWSAYQDLAMLSLPDLAAGRHYFQVRAMDRFGNMDSSSTPLDFTVVAPWFHEIRLWIILLIGLATALFFAALALNRHRQLIRSHAAIEQKVAERTRELEIATRELLHSQKMNALGTLAAGIAHDFNNILSIIKGSAQIIEDNPDHPEKIRIRVNRIKTVVQQGAEIVDAMLGFGRGSDAVRPCEVNAVVADTLRLLGDRFQGKANFSFERAEKLPEVVAARELIQQILLNFIFNAVEAMTSRGKITLTTRWVDRLPPDIFLSPANATAFVLIAVADEGSGIDPQIRARIFEPFFTTKAMSARRGTGLGLSMVYELAKKMGAGLAVQSVVGQGSTFTLILPAPNPPVAAAADRAPGTPEPIQT